MQQKKLRIAVLVAGSDSANLQNDKNLLQIYGESILQITYYRLKELFDKIFVVVDNFDKETIYARQLEGGEVIVNLNKVKNELTAVLAALNACAKIPEADSVFFARANMPLIDKKVVQFVLGKENSEVSAVIPQHANGTVETMHALYKIRPALWAFERAALDEKRTIGEALNYLTNFSLIPVNEIIKIDPQLQSFFRVESEIDFQKAKSKLQGKTFKGRIKKAEKIKGAIVKENETNNTIYFKVPGTEETHEVVFHKRTKKWGCDCRHFVMRATYCSHILAAQNVF